MTAVTATSIIREALTELGVVAQGETPSSDDMAYCLNRLNDMLDSWGANSQYIYARADNVITLAAGVGVLTIGPGGMLSVPRPSEMDIGSYSRVSSVDQLLTPLSASQFNAIPYKTQQAIRPTVFYYDAADPVANVAFWPIPANNVELHLLLESALTNFADLVTSYDVPAGYKQAMYYTLAESIQGPFNKTMSAAQINTAREARRTVKLNNLGRKRMDMQMPSAVLPRRGGFNINSMNS